MLGPDFSPWPSFTKEEADKVTEVLLSNKVNYWTGQECRLFEEAFAKWCNVNYAIAVANGTLALELSLKGLGLKAGDEVIVPSRTFMGSASAVVTCNATPIFSDIDLHSQNITANQIEKVITSKTKAVIVVHLGGMPCDMDPIMALAKKQGFYVIEDCAQAHGAKYKNQPVGSLGHVAAWSFCQDKIMTTGGEGGMVTTNDKALWERMWAYKDHGKSYHSVFEKNHPEGFRWLHDSIGSNFRMTEMQAAIGRIQLTRMPRWTAKRREYALKIQKVLTQFSCVEKIENDPTFESAYYKCYLFLNPDRLKEGHSRDSIMHNIKEGGVPCFSGSCAEIYREKAFVNLNLAPKERFPNAKKLGETSIMFLVHPTLIPAEIEKTCKTIVSVLTDAQERK